MSSLPTLTRLSPSTGEVRAVALLLHGGKDRSTRAVDSRSASWRRMAAVQRAVSPALQAEGVATWLLRWSVRGWNGGGGPVADARRALARVGAEHPGAPVALLGHSMGARTAVHVADHPQVRGVVALAPWFLPGDPVDALAGRRLVAAHGRRDRITSARATRAYVERAAPLASSAAFVDMGRVGHYLLTRVDAWHEVATTEVLRTLAREG